MANPECIETLREEINDALDGGDLSNETLGRMHKLDSFIRETQRISALGNCMFLSLAFLWPNA